jgi:hypothetical protein
MIASSVQKVARSVRICAQAVINVPWSAERRAEMPNSPC